MTNHTLMYDAVKRFGPQWKLTDLAAYEKKRQENLTQIELENARIRDEYQACLLRHLDALRAPAGQRRWMDCPLDDRYQLILDIVNITRGELFKALEDARSGRCRLIAKDKYDCTAPEPAARSQLGACNYQCGVSLYCARATKEECTARAHSVFIEGRRATAPTGHRQNRPDEVIE